MNHKLPLTTNQIRFIANGIYRAISFDLPELIEENNLPTKVGSGLFRWNIINRNLSETFSGDFECSLPVRGPWKFLLLHDKSTNLSFSVMTEKNLKHLQRKPPLHHHYLEALVSKNKMREPIENQLDLFDKSPERSEGLLSDLRHRLLSEFCGIIKEHVLILFDNDFESVISCRAVLLTPSLGIAVSENWTQHMVSKYMPSSLPILKITSDEDVPLVKLKANYVSNATSIVQLIESKLNNQSK